MKIYQQLWTVFSNSTHLPLYPKHSEFFLVLYTAVTDSERLNALGYYPLNLSYLLNCSYLLSLIIL